MLVAVIAYLLPFFALLIITVTKRHFLVTEFLFCDQNNSIKTHEILRPSTPWIYPSSVATILVLEG